MQLHDREERKIDMRKKEKRRFGSGNMRRNKAAADAAAVNPTRESEAAKYEKAYKHRRYSAGVSRMREALHDLQSLATGGSLLDVGCGRGEFLDLAEDEGFDPCKGTEIVSRLIDGKRVVYGEAHALPFEDDSFDVVTTWDVLEHLVPGDDEKLCREIDRIAKRYILLSANNLKAYFRGMLLHINRRSYDEWDGLLRSWFSGDVSRVREKRMSETWMVRL